MIIYMLKPYFLAFLNKFTRGNNEQNEALKSHMNLLAVQTPLVNVIPPRHVVIKPDVTIIYVIMTLAQLRYRTFDSFTCIR